MRFSESISHDGISDTASDTPTNNIVTSSEPLDTVTRFPSRSCKFCCVVMAASMITLLVCSYYTIAIRAGQCHYTLEGMNLGINTFCQRTDLSVLDRSICEDGRMSKLFFIFIDGVPFSHFKDMTTSDKYGKYSLVFPLDNGMIDLTGPIWRTGVLGRLDGNFDQDIKTVDNVFTQIVANGGVDIEFVLHSDYPTRMNVGHPYVDESRIRVPPGGDSIRKICEG